MIVRVMPNDHQSALKKNSGVDVAEALKVATIQQHAYCLFARKGDVQCEQDVSNACCDLEDIGVTWDTFKGITSNIVRRKLVECLTPSNTKKNFVQ